ncbi:DHH superfamily protein, subfamily 1 [Treponema primitia ZAS-2]|uniref:DHH superfamily protein, subfamily 1 n=1 Tax=Treponema primitia (strain ATCC BAA-887 / DSM 12427 / ZAS-2) TaxID=545694 RepID=F5YPN1_TREPZ|nr:DHH superfamily protein, subfamily 1 [Treponema primitia ZAS-2]
MKTPIPQALLEFIQENSKFLIAGHREPDGDCVGSQLALGSVLERLGKEVIPCSAGPFKRGEIKGYEPRFSSGPTDAERSGAAVIILDCSSPERTGDLAPFLKGLPTATIDHHRTGETHEFLSYLDPSAPSTTFLVLELIEALGLSPTKEEAELLFFGLCTDTGFFRHVDDQGAETFRCASRLIDAGANPKRVFQAMNGGKTLDSRILMGTILAHAESYFGGKLLFCTETLEDTQRYGLEGRDSDSLYQLLQAVEGVEAIVIIRQESPDNCTVGFRSRDAVDVAAIAAGFGGGGHKNAAGLSVGGVIEELRPQILQAFQKVFNQNP